jgi:hypothetical protein
MTAMSIEQKRLPWSSNAMQRAERVCASRPLQYDAGSGPESVGIDAVDSLCTIEAIAPTAIKTLWAPIASVSLG